MAYQQSDVSGSFHAGRRLDFNKVAWHAISRHAQNIEEPVAVIGLNVHRHVMETCCLLGNPSQAEYYFDRHGITLLFADDADSLREAVSMARDDSVLLAFRVAVISEDKIHRVKQIMSEAEFDLCQTAEFGLDTLAYHYSKDCKS